MVVASDKVEGSGQSDMPVLDQVESPKEYEDPGSTPDLAILVPPLQLDRLSGRLFATPASVRRGEGRQVALGMEMEEGEVLSPRADALEVNALSIA